MYQEFPSQLRCCIFFSFENILNHFTCPPGDLFCGRVQNRLSQESGARHADMTIGRLLKEMDLTLQEFFNEPSTDLSSGHQAICCLCPAKAMHIKPCYNIAPDLRWANSLQCSWFIYEQKCRDATCALSTL